MKALLHEADSVLPGAEYVAHACAQDTRVTHTVRLTHLVSMMCIPMLCLRGVLQQGALAGAQDPACITAAAVELFTKLPVW